MSNQPKKQSFLGGAAVLTAAVVIVKLIGAVYKLPLNNILGSVGKTYFDTAYLIYNWHPAKVFMGDTGSLFLGGAVVGMAFALDMPLVLLLVGLVYIVETLSDILQVGYFKLTHGKRIFKMAPIHHHFEMCGWSEKKIWTVFVLVTVLMCVVAWFGVRIWF